MFHQHNHILARPVKPDLTIRASEQIEQSSETEYRISWKHQCVLCCEPVANEARQLVPTIV